MRNLSISIDGNPMTIDIQDVDCHLLAEGKVGLEAKILLRQTGKTRVVSFTTTPRVSASGWGVSLEDIQYPEGKELSPELTKVLMQKASEILNLRNFEMEGISLRIHQLDVDTGKLTLQAEANVTQFPSA
jgi:hypothetical protein